MNPPTIWIQVAILTAGLILPPVLGVVSVARASRIEGSAGPRRLSFVLGVVALANWLMFFILLSRSRDSHPMPYRLSSLQLLVTALLVLVSLRGYTPRAPLIIANLVLVSLWFTFGYAPEHWLTLMNKHSVAIGQRKMPAAIYFGNPRNSEAEAIALIHVPNVGNYYFDFAEEKYRRASEWDIVPTPYGAWTWRRMTDGQLHEPLPSPEINECQIPLLDGHVLTVTF